jgi:hypothetical protein
MTQICHTPDPGLFCNRTRWLSIKFAILRKSRKSSSVKAEYLRVMLGDTTANVPIEFFGPGSTGSLKVSQNIDLIRAGINYKFGGPAGGRY